MTPQSSAAAKRARLRSLAGVAKRVEHEFQDLDLLDRALTHASAGNMGKANYERLEFLGDAFLGFAVADQLYRKEPEIAEGELTEARAALVSRQPLARIATDLGLSAALETGRGMDIAALESPRIQADLVEAVLAAIYLDGGVRSARKFVRKFVMPALADYQDSRASRDSKSRLLHHCQKEALGQPVYELVEVTGPAHQQTFQVEVLVQDEVLGAGSGKSKQAAEKAAATEALKTLQPEPRPPGRKRKKK